MSTISIKKIQKVIQEDSTRRERIARTKRYYANENDIKIEGIVPADKDPLRNADNRVSHNYHQIIVDECAAYMFSYPVLFDLGDKKLNEQVADVLGDDFAYTAMQLGIEASNSSSAWLHYWTGKSIKGAKKQFHYAVVKGEQIIPVYSSSLIKTLQMLYRYYEVIEEDEKDYVVVEVWSDVNVITFKFQGSIAMGFPTLVESKKVGHKLGRIPFIEFRNNNRHQDDLPRYYDLINIYDKVMSGYINDLEDIQQLIYVLENYGGQDLKEFLGDLKRYKAIKVDKEDGGGGVNTLSIDIPVEARNSLLEITKKAIYEAGQALQADIESVGNASGQTLKFFYRKLELKSALKQPEFMKGFNELVTVIMLYLGNSECPRIKQTWTRNMISNDVETAQIARDSVGIIPMKLIWKNHPWVEDVEECETLWIGEQQETINDPYAKKDVDTDGKT